MISGMALEPFYVSKATDCAECGFYCGCVAHVGSFAAQWSARGTGGVVLLLSGECATDDGQADPVRLYGERGDSFVEGLNGIFSGVLIDTARHRALLFNDRYGIERLYVHQTDESLYFASEAKALLRVVPELRALDDAAVAEFLAFGCTRQCRALFRGVELVGGGALWVLEQGSVRKRRYFHPTVWERQSKLSAEQFDCLFLETFRAVLPRYLSGQPGIGISLTGGLDTRMIMACLPEEAVASCYTFSGEDARLLDERIARRVATVRNLPHSILRIDRKFLSEYASHVDRTVSATEGMFGATGAHEIYLNRLARDVAPIRLTGNFGSEILRSMSTFKPIGLSSELLTPEVGEAVRALSAERGRTVHPVTASAFEEIPWGLFGSFAAARSQVTFRTPYLDNDIVALAYRAPDGARHSPDTALLLVSRSPALAAIPTDRGLIYGDRGLGRLGRRIFSEATFKLDYLHKDGLPSWLMSAEPLLNALSGVGLLGLHKYLPYRRWFRSELAPYVREVLTDAKTARLPYWRPKALDKIVEDHVRGRRNHVKEINAVLTLEAIDRLLLHRSASTLPLPETVGSR
jgi:asparagine synthase (glutamine-hydrolysing)